MALYTALGNVGLPFYAYWISPALGGNMGTWGPQEYLDAMAPVPNFAGLKFTDFQFHTFQNLLSRSGPAPPPSPHPTQPKTQNQTHIHPPTTRARTPRNGHPSTSHVSQATHSTSFLGRMR